MPIRGLSVTPLSKTLWTGNSLLNQGHLIGGRTCVLTCPRRHFVVRISLCQEHLHHTSNKYSGDMNIRKKSWPSAWKNVAIHMQTFHSLAWYRHELLSTLRKLGTGVPYNYTFRYRAPCKIPKSSSSNPSAVCKGIKICPLGGAEWWPR